MKKVWFWSMLWLILLASGCTSPSVRVTKTAKGFFQPTKPDDIEILMLTPQRGYTELAVVITENWKAKKTAKMHNSLRAKCAPLGADAVVIGASGLSKNGYFWAYGAAILYKD